MIDIAPPRPVRLPKPRMALVALIGLAFATIFSNVFEAEVTSQTDNEYGVDIPGGICPDVPTTAADHTVNTEAEFNIAMSALDNTGGIIEIEDGSYDWGTVSLTANGLNEDNRIYIRAATLHGVTFSNDEWTLASTAKFITISGIVKNHGGGGNPSFRLLQSDNIRLACMDINDSGSGGGHFVFADQTNTDFVDDIEFDNNDYFVSSLDGHNVIRTDQCVSYNSACEGMSSRWHIHHNKFFATSAANQAIYPGLGFIPQDPADPENNPKDYGDWLVENNHFSWIGDDWEDFKHGGVIVRFNCFESGTKLSHHRVGNENLYLGNWWRGAPESAGINNTWFTVMAFNYIKASGREAIFKPRSGQGPTPANPNIWGYWSASEGTYSNNVCDGCTYLIDHLANVGGAAGPLLIGAQNKPLPINNLIQNNLIRNSATVNDYKAPSDGHDNETDFKNRNTLSGNTYVTGEKSGAACFTPGHAEGLGTSVAGSSRLPTFGGTLDYSTTINAPSWW